MLADVPPSGLSSGRLNPTIQQPEEFVDRLLDRIADHLPEWRDEEFRPAVDSETELTSQLCEYLNSATRHDSGWDVLQFRTEVRDETKGNRSIDLTVKPCGIALLIGQNLYYHYRSILPIECKRLPTPSGKDRDEREYVHGGSKLSGGVQRFKCGQHGASHSRGAMIGYVQSETIQAWTARVNGWVGELCILGADWKDEDRLVVDRDVPLKNVCTLTSCHARTQGKAPIRLKHLWVRMN